MGTSINTDECCVCHKLHSYPEDFDTDGQRIKCSCDRWIYEDCVDSEGIDNIGQVFLFSLLISVNLLVYKDAIKIDT